MGGLGLWRVIGVALAGFLLFHGSCYSEKAPYYTFLQQATSAPPTLYYDYIIIGGGTSGCSLAATLSQSASVLVLERGGSPYEIQNMTNLNSFATTLSNNSPSSPSQSFVSQDGVLNARARVLGGGSVINAGFYTRASDNYVKEVGWDGGLVRRSYEWVEKKVAFKPPMLGWQSAVRDGLLEVGVLPYNGFTYEHWYGTKVGGTIFDLEGHRHTAADLLEYANPSRVNVLLHATVEKIMFRTQGEPRPRAYGVIFKDALGYKHKAYLTKDSKNEVILSSGAIGSPQLLMLSGIGPKNHLMANSVNVLLDQPMVGQGMSDNPMNALFIPSPHPVEQSLIQVVGITRFDSYIEAASGSNFGYAWAPNLEQQNQNGQPSMVPQTQTPQEAIMKALRTLNPNVNSSVNVGVIIEKIMGPLSTGHLELRSKKVEDTPFVTFNYFKEPEDLRRCVQGMSTIINVINSRSYSKFRDRLVSVQQLINLMVTLPVNLRPKHISAALNLEQFCIDTVMTIWHYHGGCQVGRVVDHDYRVLGVDALRVIDGSTFSRSPGTNPQATVMMLGRYMGEKILYERFQERKK